MKKVVINVCYGGFGLSLKAQKRYLELCGKEAYFYKQTKYKHNGGIEEHARVSVDDKKGLFAHTVTKDFGDSLEKLGKEFNDCYFSDRDIERDDPKLVKVVEEMGEEANGDCASLKIVEVPDDAKWLVDEYDGFEHIAEEHRTWS